MTHSHATVAVSGWVARFGALVAPGARVLDLACGHGRHARWFAARGASVVAVDRDVAALESLRDVAGIATRLADLEAAAWPIADERFDAIVVANYLHRPLFPRILDALGERGVLLYETFAAGNEVHGRPSNPAFLLQPGELLERVRERLVVVAFEQGRVETGGRVAVVQRIAAVTPAYGWPPTLPAPEP